MSKFLSWLKTKLTIHETYTSASYVEDIIIWLEEKSGENWFKGKFSVSKEGFEHYRITSKVSMGTIQTFGMNGIACHVHLNSPDKEQITITTKIRLEHYIFLVGFSSLEVITALTTGFKRTDIGSWNTGHAVDFSSLVSDGLSLAGTKFNRSNQREFEVERY